MANGEASGVPGSGDSQLRCEFCGDGGPAECGVCRVHDAGSAMGVDIGDGTGPACLAVPCGVGEFIVKNMKAWDGLGLAGVGIADAADEPAIVAPCECRTWAYDECDSAGPTDSGHHPRCPNRPPS